MYNPEIFGQEFADLPLIEHSRAADIALGPGLCQDSLEQGIAIAGTSQIHYNSSRQHPRSPIFRIVWIGFSNTRTRRVKLESKFMHDLPGSSVISKTTKSELLLRRAVLERAESQITLRALGERLLEAAADPELTVRGFTYASDARTAARRTKLKTTRKLR